MYFITAYQDNDTSTYRYLCNHRRAYKFFTDSISPKCYFTSFPCENYDKFQAGGQPVEVNAKPRERIKKEVIRTIIDFLTSEEVQQSVAYGTILVKGPDGTDSKAS